MPRGESVKFENGTFPYGGYPMLDLSDVFEKYGPVHGMTELERRSVCPPKVTSNAEIAVDIMRDIGQLPSLVTVDYVELSH